LIPPGTVGNSISISWNANEGEWYERTDLYNFQVHFLNFFKARTDRLTMVNDDHGADFQNESRADTISLHTWVAPASRLSRAVTYYAMQFGVWSPTVSVRDVFDPFAAHFQRFPTKPYFLSEIPDLEYEGDPADQEKLTRIIWGAALGGAGVVVQNNASFGFDPHVAMPTLLPSVKSYSISKGISRGFLTRQA
jgi:hypothetical protein